MGAIRSPLSNPKLLAVPSCAFGLILTVAVVIYERLGLIFEAGRISMIDVKTAVQRAMDYAKEIFTTPVPELSVPMLPSLLLEEVEMSDDEKFWYVTLGWDADRLGTNWIYKIFKTRAEDGEVVSVKIRTQQNDAYVC
jgi:hypothetical protein